MITAEQLADLPLFAGADIADLQHVVQQAADIRLEAGEYAANEGERARFFVVISGSLELTHRVGRAERQLLRLERSDTFGDISLLIGSALFANLRALVPSQLMRLEPVAFDNLLKSIPLAASAMAKTMGERLGSLRSLSLSEGREPLTIVGARYAAACYSVRDFLLRNQVAYEWLEAEDAELLRRYPELAARTSDGTLLRLANGTILVDPTLRETAAAIGLRVNPAKSDYDLAIIGAGPAGLAAAVYGASEGLACIVIDADAPGGQAGTSSRIENYLGFPAGISGNELTDRALRQALRLGAEVVVTRSVRKIAPGDERHGIQVDGGFSLTARTIVIATGVRWRTLDLERADDFLGRGLFYGAAQTEAESMLGRDVLIVGGGNSAGQAAIFFANYAATVTIIVRHTDLCAGMSAYLVAEIGARANITVELHSEVVQLEGDTHLEAVTIGDRINGVSRRQTAGGVFVFIGADADTDWLPSSISRDKRGFIQTGSAIPTSGWTLERDPFLLESAVPGIFAIGDVRHESIKRVAAAVGEGSMAIAFVHQHLAAKRL
jgi:thioredoxin reductase (NADPH)